MEKTDKTDKRLPDSVRNQKEFFKSKNRNHKEKQYNKI